MTERRQFRIGILRAYFNLGLPLATRAAARQAMPEGGSHHYQVAYGYRIALSDKTEDEVEMSSRKRATKNNVEEAFSKLEDSLAKVQASRPKVDETLPAPEDSIFICEPVKKVAQWYIDTTEDLANHGIALRKSSAMWATGTPWAPLFDVQYSIAKRFIENSVMVARDLWQVQRFSSSHHNS